jgi:LysM repeat protein
VDSCRAELVSVRSTIAASCKASTDVFIYQGVKYPATLRVELMLNAFDVSCYKEKSTGTLCDLVLAEMRNGSRPVNGCSDCLLGPARLQLSSPVGYDADTAQEFSSATVNCSASGYSYTTPPPFAISSTSTTPSPPQQTCAGSTKAVSTGDTCFSIAEANGVSTYGLITANNLDIYCSRLPSTVCLPPTCQTYEWKPYDTCEDVVAQAGITLAQVLAWNPLFDSTCSNAQRWRGWTVCIG